jgi:hypothetical protein
MSIIYAEAYPDKFRNDSVGLGFPWHITYKVINNSDTDYDWDVIKNNSRTDVHGDS